MKRKTQDNPPDNDAALEQLDRGQLLSLVKQMLQIHPDLAQLLDALDTHEEEAQPASTDPELYRLKVNEIFYDTDRDSWGSEARAAEPLMDIMEIGDDFLAKQRYADATMIFEIVVRATIDNYDSFRWHPYEGELDDVVMECVEALGTCLQKVQGNTKLRSQIIQTLRDVYAFDLSLENDEPRMSEQIPAILTRYTTPSERKTLAAWTRKTFDLDIDWENDDLSEDYNYATSLLLGLENDTIDDETFARLCRETENTPFLIERQLSQGHVQEALAEAQQVESYNVLDIADIFCEHGYEAEAERIVEERSQRYQDEDLLKWLQERHEARGDITGALALARRLFLTPGGATIERYHEIHQFAEESGQWESVQPELLASVRQSHNIKLEIEIALYEDRPQEALALLQSQPTGRKQDGPYSGDLFDVGLKVAKAVETIDPLAAIDIYQKYVDKRIEWRGRENYQVACQYLVTIRRLFEKLGLTSQWTTYLSNLRTQNNKLPALKDEMAKAGL